MFRNTINLSNKKSTFLLSLNRTWNLFSAVLKLHQDRRLFIDMSLKWVTVENYRQPCFNYFIIILFAIYLSITNCNSLPGASTSILLFERFVTWNRLYLNNIHISKCKFFVKPSLSLFESLDLNFLSCIRVKSMYFMDL